MFSKPSSPRGNYIVGDRATTVNNDSVYYDGGGVSAGNNTQRFDPNLFHQMNNNDDGLH
jgi:hypothetical protein